MLSALNVLAPLGYVTTGYIIGRHWVKGTSTGARFGAFFAGFGILRLVALIPGIGFLVWIVVCVYGLGAVSMAAWYGGHRVRDDDESPPDAAPPTQPPPMEPPDRAPDRAARARARSGRRAHRLSRMERSLLGILGTFRDDGFTYDFYARPGGVVECGHCHVPHPADTLELHQLERLEGDSDPSEMLAVCAVVVPDGAASGAPWCSPSAPSRPARTTRSSSSSTTPAGSSTERRPRRSSLPVGPSGS